MAAGYLDGFPVANWPQGDWSRLGPEPGFWRQAERFAALLQVARYEAWIPEDRSTRDLRSGDPFLSLRILIRERRK